MSRARTKGAARGTAATLLALASVVMSVAPAAAQTGAPEVPPGYATPGDAEPQIVQPQTAGPQIVRAQPLVVVPAYAPPIVPVAPPVRPQTIVVERSESIRALWLPGVIALPIAWISTWTSASSVFEGDALTYAWIPLIGPWLMLTQDLNGYEAGFVVLGVVQGAAALMMILGLTLRRSWTETQYVVEPIQGVRARVSFDAIALPGGGVAGVQLSL